MNPLLLTAKDFKFWFKNRTYKLVGYQALPRKVFLGVNNQLKYGVIENTKTYALTKCFHEQ